MWQHKSARRWLAGVKIEDSNLIDTFSVWGLFDLWQISNWRQISWIISSSLLFCSIDHKKFQFKHMQKIKIGEMNEQIVCECYTCRPSLFIHFSLVALSVYFHVQSTKVGMQQ